jgi:hypothetical protein
MRAGGTAMLQFDSFLDTELMPMYATIAILDAMRVAEQVGHFRLLIDEGGALGERADELDALFRAARARGVHIAIATQSPSDFNDVLRTNVGTWLLLGQGAGAVAERRWASEATGGRVPPEGFIIQTALHQLEGFLLADGRFGKVRVSPPDMRGLTTVKSVETVETVRTFPSTTWKQADGNSEPAGLQALPERSVYELPAPRRVDVPEWIRGQPVREAIWELLDGTDYDERCWLWQGERHPKGYGRFRRVIDGTKWDLLIHRAMYEYANGPIAEGWTVDHQCEPVPRTLCGNPKHLALVPRDVNTRLRWQREKARTGS